MTGYEEFKKTLKDSGKSVTELSEQLGIQDDELGDARIFTKQNVEGARNISDYFNENIKLDTSKETKIDFSNSETLKKYNELPEGYAEELIKNSKTNEEYEYNYKRIKQMMLEDEYISKKYSTLEQFGYGFLSSLPREIIVNVTAGAAIGSILPGPGTTVGGVVGTGVATTKSVTSGLKNLYRIASNAKKLKTISTITGTAAAENALQEYIMQKTSLKVDDKYDIMDAGIFGAALGGTIGTGFEVYKSFKKKPSTNNETDIETDAIDNDNLINNNTDRITKENEVKTDEIKFDEDEIKIDDEVDELAGLESEFIRITDEIKEPEIIKEPDTTIKEPETDITIKEPETTIKEPETTIKEPETESLKDAEFNDKEFFEKYDSINKEPDENLKNIFNSKSKEIIELERDNYPTEDILKKSKTFIDGSIKHIKGVINKSQKEFKDGLIDSNQFKKVLDNGYLALKDIKSGTKSDNVLKNAKTFIVRKVFDMEAGGKPSIGETEFMKKIGSIKEEFSNALDIEDNLESLNKIIEIKENLKNIKSTKNNINTVSEKSNITTNLNQTFLVKSIQSINEKISSKDLSKIIKMIDEVDIKNSEPIINLQIKARNLYKEKLKRVLKRDAEVENGIKPKELGIEKIELNKEDNEIMESILEVNKQLLKNAEKEYFTQKAVYDFITNENGTKTISNKEVKIKSGSLKETIVTKNLKEIIEENPHCNI